MDATDALPWVLMVVIILSVLGGIIYTFIPWKSDEDITVSSSLRSFWLFFYASFVKPHTGDHSGHGQQAALESFYKRQATVYDATRKRLLRGREDMLGLVAAQLKHRAAGYQQTGRVWVDVRVLC